MRVVAERVSAAVVTHQMAYAATRDALIAASEASTNSFPPVIGHGSSASDRFTIKAASTSEVAGLKVGSFWPTNFERGMPRHNSLILLFDQSVGRIETVMEAGIVNAFRTAAADAVAADRLARADAATLAIFGAGNQARYEIEALARIRDIRTVLVVARDMAKAKRFCSEIRIEGVELRPEEARDACHAADIIVTATSAREPLFDAAWVRPGTHVASMGSDGRGKQELPPELFDTAQLFCDEVSQSRTIGEFQHASPDLPVVMIGDVLAGRANGRLDASQITVFDSSGLSLQDLYIARSILTRLDSEVSAVGERPLQARQY